MGKASISIAITSNFSSKGIDAAIRKMEQLNATAISMRGKYGKAAVDAGSELGQLGARMESIGDKVAAFGDKLTKGVTLPVGVAAAATTMAAMQIDTAWYNVRKTVDMTEEGYERLKQGAMELSEVQPVSAETILNIESLGGQLGISTDYLEEFSRVVSGLDIATNLDANTAATDLAQFRNIVRMSEDDLDNWASTVVDLGNHTATTEADLVNLAMRFASAGHIAGMSNAEILGVSAALSGLGMKAEAGGSAISRTINDINTAVSVGGEKLQKWADLVKKTPEEFAAAWRSDPTKEFLDVLQHIGDAGEDMGKVLDDLGITQLRQSDAMRRLASSGEYVNEVVERANRAWGENSALTREVENRNESLEARFQTIWNRLTNTAARFGEPVAEAVLGALDALQPFIDMLADVAEAYAKATPEQQRFIANLAGVAAAAGPVLSVFGRLTSGFGTYLKWVGRVTQQYGMFTEALHTNDAAMLVNLGNNQNWATRVGLSRNEIVKSVGGIERFNEVCVPYINNVRRSAEEAMRNVIAEEAKAEAIKKGTTSEKQLDRAAKSALRTQESRRRITEAGNKAVDALTASDLKEAAAAEAAAKASEGAAAAKSEVVAASEGAAAAETQEAAAKTASAAATEAAAAADGQEAAADAEVAVTSEAAAAGERQQAAATRESGLAAQQATGQVSTFKAALLGIGGLALGAVAIAGITAIATKIQMAKERADALAKATRTLDASFDSNGKAAQAAAEGTDDFARSIGDTIRAVDDAIEKQGNLKETVDDLILSAEIEVDTLDRAWETIDKYANVTGLNASQQYELKKAIEKVNEECGTQYKVVDASKGKIADEKDEILNNTQAIKDNIEQRKKLIKIQAYEGAYEGALKTEAETATAYAEAQKEFDKVNGRIEELSPKIKDRTATKAESDEYSDLVLKSGELRDALTDAGEAADSAKRNTKALEEQYEELVGTIREAGDYVSQFASNAVLSTAFEGRVEEMAALFQDLGINMQAAEGLSASAATNINALYDGTAQSVVNAMKKMEETQYIVENIGNNWAASFDKSTQQIIDSVVGMGVYTKADLMAMAHDFELGSTQAVQGFVAGLEAGLKPGTAAEIARRFDNAFADNLTPEQAAVAAQAYMQAVKQGLNEEEAKKAAEEAIKGMQDALNGASFDGTQAGQHLAMSLQSGISNSMGGITPIVSDTGRVVGYALADGTRIGIEEGSGDIPTAVQDMVSGSTDPLYQLAPLAYQYGLGVGPSYTQGLSDGGGDTSGAVSDLWTGAVDGLQQGVPGAEGAGADTGTGYSNKIAAMLGLAQAAANSTQLAVIASYVLGIQAAEIAGKTVGQRYGGGISSTSTIASNAARAVASSATSAFSSGGSFAYSSGYSLGSNFAAGISASYSIVADAASSVAATVARVLKHSTPKEGPLRDDDVWGYHFAQNIAGGMARGVGAVRRQGAAIASAMASASDVRGAVGSISRGAALTYGASAYRRQGFGSRVDSTKAATTAAPSQAPLTKDDVREAVASALSEAVPPELAMYASGRKIASSIAGDMDYELGKLRARW